MLSCGSDLRIRDPCRYSVPVSCDWCPVTGHPVTGALCRCSVAVPCDGILWQYPVTVPRVGASRVRNLVVPCVLTPQLPLCAIPHLTPYPLSILPLLACHPLPTRLSSLSRRSFHPFVVSTPALSDSSHVSFHGVRTKTFSTHVTTKIAPDVRETGLFTHGRASLNFTIIPMCTSDVVVPCHAMPGRDVLCPRTIALSVHPACEILSCPVPNPTAPTLPNRTSGSRHIFHPHPTRFSSLSLCTFRPFVISTLALSNSSHVSFPDVRVKTFSTHVTT